MIPVQFELKDDDSVEVKPLSQGPGDQGIQQAQVKLGPVAFLASLKLLKVLRDVLNKVLTD